MESPLLVKESSLPRDHAIHFHVMCSSECKAHPCENGARGMDVVRRRFDRTSQCEVLRSTTPIPFLDCWILVRPGFSSCDHGQFRSTVVPIYTAAISRMLPPSGNQLLLEFSVSSVASPKMDTEETRDDT